MKNLPKGVFTFLDVSTGHITRKDDLIIKTVEFPLGVYEYDCGYFIHTGVITEETEQELREAEMSEAFIKVWKRAVELDCWFLRLDADGTEFEEFETFEW